MGLARSVLLAASQNAWLRRQATRRGFMRRAVRRFMPGETLDDALAAAAGLRAQGFGTVVTHLGENVTDRSEAEGVLRHYLDVLERIRATSLDVEISVKPTQFGLDFDPALPVASLSRLAASARPSGSRVWIDMEGSPYVDATLALFRALKREHDNVGLCLQSYLRRTPADLETLLPLGPAIRLVKGAYREPAAVAFPVKRDVDDGFFALAARMMSPEALGAGASLVVGTHDPSLLRRVEAHAAGAAVPRERIEYTLLYGIRRDEQARLAAAGHRTRVLISYGTYWFPWYMRRLAERPANVGFVLRNLIGG